MEDTLVDDVSRGAGLVVEGKQRNSREGSSVEASQPQQIFPQDTPYRREAKERQEKNYVLILINIRLKSYLPLY